MPADRHLETCFGSAAPHHFAWQTSAPGVAERERALVRSAFRPLGTRVLDLGCAEGGTLKHLEDPAGAVGIDIFVEKLRFAREHVQGARFVAAAGEALPFTVGAFDHILVRDVIHHVPDPRPLVAECARVLVPGGTIDLLEPCRYSPFILAHALLRPVERGELRSTPRYLEGLLTSRFRIVASNRYQPFPLHRLVYHPDLGAPRSGERRWIRRALDGVERALGRVVPRVAWAYIHVRGRLGP
jgi:SAM-dependent methyltransferase